MRSPRPAGRRRWDDEAYLTRIVFDTMTKGQQGGETGYGISAVVQDGEDHVIDIDTRAGSVRLSGKRYTIREFADGNASYDW